MVLCGPGNNGGDGFVVARLLRERGWAVEVFLYGDPEKLPPDARTNFERWGRLGDMKPLSLDRIMEARPFDLWIDAVFGTGLTRPMDGVLHEVFDYMGKNLATFGNGHVAVDIPTGMCADSGRFLGPMTEPNLIVTFHRMKVGHHLAEYLPTDPRERHSLELIDIGLRGAASGAVEIVGPPRAVRKERGHKFDHGHALVLCGEPGKGGAGRMAARGALRIGAGLVTLGCPPAALQENASRVDAVMTRPVKGAEGLAEMLEDGRLNALALGPGLGTGKREAALVRVALGGAPSADEGDDDEGSHCAPGSTRGLDEPGAAGSDAGGAEGRGPGSGAGAGSAAVGGPGRSSDVPGSTRDPDDRGADGGEKGRGPGSGAGAPGEDGGGGSRGKDRPRPATVLDGDALTILAREPDVFALLHDRCVLTPHGGEFKRLFPDIAERLEAPAQSGPAYSKVDATREAAARAGCVVLFKGPDTVIAHPDGSAAINSAHYERSAPWLATAGAGDVLAGFVAGLLARGLGPMQAAEAAAWLHVECALEFGPGLIAEDLPEQLPKVFRRLGR